MTPESKIEIAIRRTRDRMMREYPQNMDVLRALEYLAEEVMSVNLEPTDPSSEGLPRDPRFAGSQQSAS